MRFFDTKTMKWYDIYKSAFALDPDAWSYDAVPHRFQSDHDVVWTPYGGIRQKQNEDQLKNKYAGVHFTFSPEIAAVYASGKASKEDPPVIVEVNVDGMQHLPDADAMNEYEVDTYINEKLGIWEEFLQRLDDGKIDESTCSDEILNNVREDEDFFEYGQEGEAYDDISDIIVRNQKLSGQRIVQDYLEMLTEDQIVNTIRAIIGGQIPDQLTINAVNQFRVIESVQADRIIAIYKIPWINFSEIRSQHEDDEDFTVQDEVMYDIDGRIVLDYEDLDYNWLELTPIYQNNKMATDSPAFHGTSLFRVKLAFPELALSANIYNSWYKFARIHEYLSNITR